MEFPELGQHCDHPDCKQLEFLPLKCKCNKIFCPHHFNSHVESCETTVSNVVSDLKKIEETYECSADGCKATSIIPLLCSKCHKHYCLKHRHINECAPADPNLLAGGNKKVVTSIEQYNEAKASVDKELDRNLANAKRKPKNVETANKIQLMRIKNKATGSKSIPIADRIYFNVKSPTSIADKVVPVFISKSWSIGKSIDAIAQELKISNNNQQTNTLKLRLFRTDDGHILSTSMSDKMEDLLLKKIIVNGQSLILEYVSNECLCLNI